MNDKKAKKFRKLVRTGITEGKFGEESKQLVETLIKENNALKADNKEWQERCVNLVKEVKELRNKVVNG